MFNKLDAIPEDRSAPESATSADDIIEARAVIVLPTARTRSGQAVRVAIKAVPTEALAPILEAIPVSEASTTDRQRSMSEAVRRSMEFEPNAAAIAKLGIVEPAFSFEERVPGKAFWGDLTLNDQVHIAHGILAFSGWGDAQTYDFRAFRHGDGGRREGGNGVGGPRETAAESKRGNVPGAVAGSEA